MADPGERLPEIGVAGAGTMGSGIGQVALLAGHPVVLYDVGDEYITHGRAAIAGHVRRLVEKGRLTSKEAEEALGRLQTTTRLEELAGCALVIEAVPERMDLKRDLFRRLGEICRTAVLATNTSSLSVAEIARDTARPERVVGMHFFNPAPLMPLVEVVRGQNSGDEALACVTAWARAWGKTPVQAKDTPGFIVNRVARPYYLEALRIVGAGWADVPTVDQAMEAAGFRMGPFRLLDLIGIDVNYEVSRSVYEAFGHHPRFQPHPIQAQMVAAGELGRKSGRGFYAYDQNGAAVGPAERLYYQRSVTNGNGGDVHEPSADLEVKIQHRIICCLANEAAYALGEGVATVGDIDTAMKLGTNYPRGPLEWADQWGLEIVLATLKQLQAEDRWPGSQNAQRYTPAPELVERVRQGRKFHDQG